MRLYNKFNNFDFITLNNILKANTRSEKDISFERKITCTKMQCFAIKSEIINLVVKHILQGNFIDFLDKCEIINYPISIIYGKVVTKICDYNLFIKYFEKYAQIIDCWAHCDIFKLNISKLGENSVKKFINNLLKSDNPFLRRIAFVIMLKSFINSDEMSFIFDNIIKSYSEKDYYVNMSIAWLLCECFIKQKDQTLNFINHTKLNDFVLKKFISKCGDSFRVTKKDKDFSSLSKRINAV